MRDHLTLVESFTYLTFLTEASRFEFLLNTYGKKLNAFWTEHGASEPDEIKDGVANTPGDDGAAKLVNFLMSNDPSRKQIYSQWMTARVLSGGLKLEDLMRASAALSIFDRAKSRIERKDINQYASLQDLETVVEPFEKGEVAVSGKEEQDQEARIMARPENSTTVFNDAEVKIVIPRTIEASYYFGRNTKWCTASNSYGNQFDRYNRQGPLYIILDKKNNRRWQWHFESGSFMDERDVPSPMRNVLKQFPQIVPVFGDKLGPYARQLGLSFFSPEQIAGFTDDQIITSVRDKSDLAHIPAEKLRNAEFIHELIVNYRIATDGKPILSWLPPKYWQDRLADILDDSPYLLCTVPRKLLTKELVEQYGILLPTYQIQKIDKSLWSEKLTEVYYGKLVDESNPPLKDIPERYRTPQVVLKLLSANPEDIKTFESLVTPDVAAGLVKNNPNNLQRLPDAKLSVEVRDVIDDWMVSMEVKWPPIVKEATRFPQDLWTLNFVKAFIQFKDIKTFNDLPKQFRDHETALTLLIKSNQKAAIKSIPVSLLSPTVVTSVLSCYKIIPDLPASVLTDDVLVPFIAAGKGPFIQDIGAELPAKCLTPEVCEALVEKVWLPIKRIPARLMSVENVVNRASSWPAEIKDIPTNVWTEVFVEALVTKSSSAAERIPAKFLNEPVLFSALNGGMNAHDHYYNRNSQKIFDRFPESAMSSRNISLAIKAGLMKATVDSLTSKHMTEEIACSIAARSVEEYEKLPQQFKDDPKVLYAGASKNTDFLPAIGKANITEPMAYAALTRFTGSYLEDTYHENIAQLMPEDAKWSERMWDASVGYTRDLKEVPDRFRSADLVKKAVMRDPKNLRAIKDPAGYIEKHNLKLGDSKQFLEQLDDNGLTYTKKNGFQNISALPRKPLDDKSSYAELPMGPKNRRVYLFDKSGDFVGGFYTQKDRINTRLEKKELEQNKASILALANAALKGFAAGDLNSIHIYAKNHGFVDDATAYRSRYGNSEWAYLPYESGNILVGFALGSKVPFIRIKEASTGGGWGRRSSVEMTGADLLDIAACIQHNADIIRAIKAVGLSGFTYELRRVGVFQTAGGKLASILDKQLGKVGDLTVYEGAEHIAIFDNAGMVAWAKIKAGGKIGKIEIEHRHNHATSEIETAFAKVASMVGYKTGTAIASSHASRGEIEPSQGDLFS